MKKIYLLFLILSLSINFLFCFVLVKGIWGSKNINCTNGTFKKIFSDETFDLVVENEKNAAEDFTVMTRNNKKQESVFCVINTQKRINISWDLVDNKKCLQNFAWEELFTTSENHKYYYKLTRNNIQYFSYTPDLIWTYKEYWEDGKVHLACLYKGKWEKVEKVDLKSLTFFLKKSIVLQWNFEKQDWKVLQY